MIRPTPFDGGRSIDPVAWNKGEFLRALCAHQRNPGRRNKTTTDRNLRLADLCVVGDDRDVRKDTHLRSSSQAISVHSGDDRLRMIPHQKPSIDISL